MVTNPQWPKGVSGQSVQGNSPMYTPPVPQQKDQLPFLERTDISLGLSGCHMMHTIQSKMKEHSLRLKQGKIPTQGVKYSTGREVLLLGKASSRPKADSYAVEGVWKAIHVTTIPKTIYLIWENNCFIKEKVKTNKKKSQIFVFYY